MFRSTSLALVAVVACVATCEADTLRQGSRGAEVSTLQTKLVSMGYRISVDGIYGPKTAAAVRAFQRDRRLPATGRFDATTASSLARPLQRGDRGAAVAALQRFLNTVGARIQVDGIFGPATERAVATARRQGNRIPSAGATRTQATQAEPAAPSAGRSSNASARLRQLIGEARRVLRGNPNAFRSDLFVIVDFALPSNQKRFFVVSRNGNVESYYTAHGRGSDPSHTGYARSFSNVNRPNNPTKKSCVGVFRTAETYRSTEPSIGHALRLDGLSGTNSNARARGIVIHGASYVSERSGRAGRSWGCPALDQRVFSRLVNRLKGGVLLYAPDPR